MSTSLRARVGALSSAFLLFGLIAPSIVVPAAHADEVETPTGAISGSVVDVIAAPVIGADVELFALVEGAWASEPAATAATDVSGDYVFEGVADGTYAVRAAEVAEVSDFIPTWFPSTPAEPAPEAVDGFVIVASAAVDDIDVVLLPVAIEATAVPEITGTPQVTATLSSSEGEWNVGGLTITRQWMRGTEVITGATGDTYSLVPADLGKEISVTVTAARQGFVAVTASSLTTGVVTPAALAATTPTISGTMVVGASLTARPGTWTNGTTLTYQWLQNGSAISGATNSTYTLKAADAGGAITVRVSGSKPGYATTAMVSVPTARVALAATPKVTGTYVVGETLTAVPGTWTSGTTFTYQWLRHGSPVSGATASTYKLTTADQGKSVTIQVTGTKSGHTTVMRASASTLNAVAPATPKTLTGAIPQISGTVAVGQKLSVTTGTWTVGTKLTYQWLRNGKTITGATASAYSLVTADANAAISVMVTGTQSGYATLSKTSVATVKVQVVAVPKIAGSMVVGTTLTATPGTWTSGAALTYVWLRDGSPISGATKNTYVLNASDSGKLISVRVTGKKSGYATIALTSVNATRVMSAGTPAVSGTAKMGSTLTAKTGTWTSGTTFTYAWMRNGVVIAGSSGATYNLTASDVGKTITVKVTGTKPGVTTVSRTSVKTAVVAAGTLTAPVPAISGTAKVGSTLTAKTGTWTSGTTLTYAWMRNGAVIAGSSGATYKLTASDVGKTITVKVTGSKAGSTTVSRTSAKTAVVAAGTLSAPVPTIEGTKRVAHTLTAKTGTWGPSPVALKYQWYRNGVAISNATKSTYKLVAGDIGKTITVRVTGSKTAYVTASKTSAATGKIADASWYAKKFGVFASKTFSGTGDDVIAVPAGMRTGIITAEVRDTDYFSVWALDKDREDQSSPFWGSNDDGTFSGSNAYGAAVSFSNEQTFFFEVNSDGPWTITLSPIDSAPQLPKSGSGTGVYKYDGAAKTVTIGAPGDDYFSSWQYFDGKYGYDAESIAYGSGPIRGRYLMSKGPSIVVIETDGSWTVTG